MKLGCLTIFIIIITTTIAIVEHFEGKEVCYWSHLCFQDPMPVSETIIKIIVMPIVLIGAIMFWWIILWVFRFFGGEYDRKATIDLKGNKYGQANFKKGCFTFILIFIGIIGIISFGGLIMNFAINFL